MRASLGALTAERFESEARAARKRHSSPRAQSLEPHALSPLPVVDRPAQPRQTWGDDALRDAQSNHGAGHPLLLHAVAQCRGGRAYMEDRSVWVEDLGTLSPRLQGTTYACVLDGHGGARCVDFAARELHLSLIHI